MAKRSKRQVRKEGKRYTKNQDHGKFGIHQYDANRETRKVNSYGPVIILTLLFILSVVFVPKIWIAGETKFKDSSNPNLVKVAKGMEFIGEKTSELYDATAGKIVPLEKDRQLGEPGKKSNNTVVNEPEGQPKQTSKDKVDTDNKTGLANTKEKPIVIGEYEVITRVDTDKDDSIIKYSEVPEWDGKTEILELNDDNANFTDTELNSHPFQYFSQLDELNRPGQANAMLVRDMQPKSAIEKAKKAGKSAEEIKAIKKEQGRGAISKVLPPGWVRDNGKTKNNKPMLGPSKKQYFYDRSHLVGHQLGGVNAEPTNLVTGAREFNAPNMVIYENIVDDSLAEGNTIRYQVTPIYNSTELVPRGVQMRAYSLEDKGQSANYNVFIYNVNIGHEIDYKTGEIIK